MESPTASSLRAKRSNPEDTLDRFVAALLAMMRRWSASIPITPTRHIVRSRSRRATLPTLSRGRDQEATRCFHDVIASQRVRAKRGPDLIPPPASVASGGEGRPKAGVGGVSAKRRSPTLASASLWPSLPRCRGGGIGEATRCFIPPPRSVGSEASEARSRGRPASAGRGGGFQGNQNTFHHRAQVLIHVGIPESQHTEAL